MQGLLVKIRYSLAKNTKAVLQGLLVLAVDLQNFMWMTEEFLIRLPRSVLLCKENKLLS